MTPPVAHDNRLENVTRCYSSVYAYRARTAPPVVEQRPVSTAGRSGSTEYAILKKGRESRQVRSQDLASALSGIGSQTHRDNQDSGENGRKTRIRRIGENLAEGSCGRQERG